VILEIGPRPYVGRAFPAETLFFSTDSAKDRPQEVEVLPTLASLWTALDRADLELIVCHPNYAAAWSLRHLNRSLFSWRFVEGRSPLFRALGPELLRWRGRAPIAVVDHEDLPLINRNNLGLLDRCRVYFKRELPVDRWRVFLKTAHANLPTPRFRLDARRQAWTQKLRPLSLGLPLNAGGLLPLDDRPKQADVFFAGRTDGSSTVRPRGLAELKALASEGIAVDIAEAPLDPAAFYERCARAWLVWSPEGLGWDCFRHYEAAACGSVPLINLPTIERHRPMVEGEQALYYEPEPGGLARAIRSALADKPRLARIAAAAKTHVLSRHTPDALARYVREEACRSVAP
jgi:hypothetical protein